jgi:mono/diheme cytochrome c family protein
MRTSRHLLIYGAVFALISIFSILGCYDMHDQPSFKAQEGPRLGSPGGSVPVQGLEMVPAGTVLVNPVVRAEESVLKGKTLYEINCAMCHGSDGKGGGRVGSKWLPQPANLHQQRIQRLSDGDIFNRIMAGYGTMPAFKKRIPPEDRWHIVNYIRDFK